MGRPSKKTSDTPTQKVEKTNVEQETPSVASNETESTPIENVEETKVEKVSSSVASDKKELTPEIEGIMKLYPQYERIYITKEGFVHPYGVPKHLTEGATLYTNKYYKQ